MTKKFEEVQNKNFELLRFYLSNDIAKIRREIDNSNNQILGYFISSLVDIFIVLLFNEYFNKISMLNKLMCIIGLILLFVILSKLSCYIIEKRKIIYKEKGKHLKLERNVKEKVDCFDNIAFDSLLICMSYISRFNELAKEDEERKDNQMEKEDNQIDKKANQIEKDIKKDLMEFYYFEVIHYLKKANNIFLFIDNDRDSFISSKNSQLIDPYRINNFISLAKNINNFLQMESTFCSKNEDIEKDLKNLNSTIDKWKMYKK